MRKESGKLQEFLKAKREKHQVRVTSFISGALKNRFIDDCIYRDWTEAKMAKHIIDTYYKITDSNPIITGKELNEIQKYIIDRIKI